MRLPPPPGRFALSRSSAAQPIGRDDRTAVVVIVATALALSTGDALIKAVSADFTLWQIFFLRSLVAIPALVAATKVTSRRVSLRPRRVFWTTTRSLVLTSMWVVYYAALPHVALSEAAAAYYTLPIFITLFAAVFARERIRPQGWIAVGLGFAGVLLLLKPDVAGFNRFAVLPVFAAVLYAAGMIITRTKCRDESPLVLSLTLNWCFIIVGGAGSIAVRAWAPSANPRQFEFLAGQWTQMGPGEWIAIVVLSVALVIGSVGAAVAYQKGRSSLVATFDFSYVPFAALWGYLAFEESPDPVSLAGMTLIVVAGVLAVQRRAPLTRMSTTAINQSATPFQ